MPVTYSVENHIATLTLDRPEALNAIDLDMLSSLGAATERFESDDDAWVGIVIGAGERAFCAGADIKTTIRTLMDDPRSGKFTSPATFMRGQELTKPVIAAVNGVALGGGLEIMLACDIRIASNKARFGAPEVSLGLIPGWGATQRLPRQIPYAVAAKLVLSGEMITADEALACGLVNSLVAPEELRSAAIAAAATLCTRGPVALRAAKQALNATFNTPLTEGLKVEQDLFDGLAYTSDVQEGIAAFEAKRPPVFAGR
jgi:enoyl-CoA hydratase